LSGLLPPPGLRPAVCGSLGYLAGALCDLVNGAVLVPGVFASHELLHVCVLVGTLIHFRFLLRVVAPYEVMAVADNGDHAGGESFRRYVGEARRREHVGELVGTGGLVIASKPSDEADARDDVHAKQDPPAWSKHPVHLADTK